MATISATMSTGSAEAPVSREILIARNEQGGRSARYALEVVAHNPIIGVGIGQNVLALNEVGAPRWSLVHNVYLQIAVDLGIPALLVYVLLFYRAMAASIRGVW